MFNGIINEKTVVGESSPLSEVLEEFCPQYQVEPDSPDKDYTKSVVHKLMSDLAFKLHNNNLRISYDSPILLEQPEQVVWNNTRTNILLPIRLPPGHRMLLDSPGFIDIKILPVKKLKEAEKDPYEFLKSPRRVCSSGVALKSTFKLMNNAIQQISAKHKEDVVIQTLEVDRGNMSILVSLLVTEQYMYGRSKTSLSHNTSGKKSISRKESRAADASESFVQPEEVVMPEDLAEEAEPENGWGELSLAIEPEPSFIESVVSVPLSRPSKIRGQSFPPVELHFNIIPAVSDPNEESSYLTTSPYVFCPLPNPDVWTFSFARQETALLQAITKADRGLRLRAWVGVTRILASEEELSCLQKEHVKHAVFFLAEKEIDFVSLRWQRVPLAEYIITLLTKIKDCCAKEKLEHFFLREMNLLSGLTRHHLRTIAMRLELLIRNKVVLLRTLEAAGTAIACSSDTTLPDGDDQNTL